MNHQTFILPAYLGPALINNDWSYLNKDEETEILNFLEQNDLGSCVEMSDNTLFAHSNDLNNIGGDVAEFYFV